MGPQMKSFAKFLMKLVEVTPNLSIESAGLLNEIFRSDLYRDATEATQREIQLKCARAKYHDEAAYSWANYFGMPIEPILRNTVCLDLGSFTGGRGIFWAERYKIKKLYGVDIDETYIAAAKLLAHEKKVDTDFRVSRGEKLPFVDEFFDCIVTFDVLEHVQSVTSTLEECYRVLKPGGHMLLVFPSYWQPIEHHLGLVTRLPAIHWLFSGKTLINAYDEILAERGDNAHWYRRSEPQQPWERGNTINGTTMAVFRSILRGQDWEVVHQSRKPIFSIGRNLVKKPYLSLIGRLLVPLVYLPGLEELLLHRITFILRKPK